MPTVSILSPYYVDIRKRQMVIYLMKRYTNLLARLGLNIHSKPVTLLLSALFSSASIFSCYQLIRVICRLKRLFRRRQGEITNRQFELSESHKADFYGRGKYQRRQRVIFVPYKNRRLEVCLNPTNYDRYEHDRLIFKKFMKEHESISETGKHMSRLLVESKFFTKLYIIWKHILVPKVFYKNTYLLLTHIVFLITRTWMTLLVTKLDGQIMKDLIGFKVKLFFRDILYWFLFAIPASYVNAAIKYLTKRLALNFRTNLVRYCHDIYVNPRVAYYKLQYNYNKLPEYELSYKTVDQNIVEDISKFSSSLTSLFSSLGKPAIDLVFFAIYLRDNIGTPSIIAILINYLITGLMLKRRSPNFNRMWKKRTQLEGIYYNYNLNLVANAEEISFYKGVRFEKSKVLGIFKELSDQIMQEMSQRFSYQLFEDYVLKSVWPALGYLFAGLPILFSSEKSGYLTDSTSNMKSFIVNKRLILSMADAGSRLMYSVKDISGLSGVTDLDFTLLVNLHQVHDVNFQYGLTNSQGNGFTSNYKIHSYVSQIQLANGNAEANAANNNAINGTIQFSYPGLRMEKCPVIIPSQAGIKGRHLLNNITFNISKGQNLLILGKNGVGKTAVIRIISELWPLYSGLLSKPDSNDIYYVSQRPYFIDGTFRDQIIYPLNYSQMLRKGYTDDVLIGYLNEVGLGYLLERFGSLDFKPGLSDLSNATSNHYDTNSQNHDSDVIEEIAISGKLVKVHDSYVAGPLDGRKTWFSLLSGGERQKLVFARIIFHHKQLIVMDEPTSAVSYDYEESLFSSLESRNVTFITISNRRSLLKHHDYLLELQQDGNAKFSKIDEEYLKHFENAQSEIKYLEAELRNMDKLKRREAELEGLLHGYEWPSEDKNSKLVLLNS